MVYSCTAWLTSFIDIIRDDDDDILSSSNEWIDRNIKRSQSQNLI